MENSNEIWKPIKGYEGLYEVSNLGRVKSLEKVSFITDTMGRVYKRVRQEKILTPHISANRLMIQCNKKIHFPLDKLVIETFVGINSKKLIQHIDGNWQNNKLVNLKYVDNLILICSKCGKEIKAKRIHSHNKNKLCSNCIRRNNIDYDLKNRARAKKWRLNNPEKSKLQSIKKRKSLPNWYLKAILVKKRGFDPITIEGNMHLLEVQKLIIKTKRLCKI